MNRLVYILMINNILKITSILCLIIITIFICLFCYKNAEIDRFKYQQGLLRADQYLIDTKTGRVFQLACSQFAKDKYGNNEPSQCEKLFFLPILPLDYDKYLKKAREEN